MESPENLAQVPGVIPTSGVPTKVGSSGTRKFQKGLFGSGLLDFDPNYSKLVENLKNKS
jgi:hypothetical protein